MKKKEVAKCQLQEQTCLPTRATTKPQTSLEMTDPHQGLETGICACLKSWHCGLTLSFSPGLDSLLLSLSLNPELKTLRCSLGHCFLCSSGMFTEVWCFAKLLISSTPCSPNLYFSNYVARTLFLALLPVFQNIPTTENSMASSESSDQSFVLKYYIHIFKIRGT